MLAPDTAASVSVIAAHVWSTQIMVVSGGRSYYTANYSTPGAYHSYSNLFGNGAEGGYSVNICDSEILIMR